MLEYHERFPYVQIDGAVYATTYTINRSEPDFSEERRYRVDLSLERRSPETVLRDVSRDISGPQPNMPRVVLRAAREGSASTSREVSVPKTPLHLGNGTYYRVYQASEREPAALLELLGISLAVFGPFVGLAIGYRLSARFEVTYDPHASR